MDDVIQTYVHGGGELHLHAYEDANEAAPEGVENLKVGAPGAGEFEFGVMGVEWQGETLVLTTQVRGENLAYLYTELLLKDQKRAVYYGPVSREYVKAQSSKSIGGITRPAWGSEVEVTARLRPVLRLLTNGADFSLCFPLPEGYTSLDYRQAGLYTPARQKGPLRALLGFSGEGALTRAIAYPQGGRRGGARAITPSLDDSFAPFVQVLTPSEAGGGWDIDTALGDTLTLGSWPLRVVTEKVLPGDYLAGVIAQDFDGGLERKYVPVRLKG